MTRLCLNMIVKNESGRITRALDSVVQFVTAAVIVDTGSTDNTKDLIETYFKQRNIPCLITDAPFEDWSQARNAALNAAKLAMGSSVPRCDYLLLMDADMELRVVDPIRFAGYAGGLSYDMYQQGGTLHYLNRRLIRSDVPGFYRGVTHEYLDVAAAATIPQEVAYFIDHADGANRPEKFRRDIRLLKEGLKKEPDNVRYFFYLAQSYRDAGNPFKAIQWYRRRIEAGGWDEEIWNSQLNIAYCFRDLKNEPEFIRNLLIAYNMRPSRAEPLYDLAHHYRMKGENASSLVFSEAGLQIPFSQDALFVNDFVYKVGLAEEFSICGFYLPQKRARGYAIIDVLSLLKTPYSGTRELARQNLYWYLPTLKEFCPSFTSRTIDFTPPENWIALNPSVTQREDGTLSCIVRTVNYRIDANGCYIIRGTDGTANNTNPINTRNYLLHLGADPMTQTHPQAVEINAPSDLPCEFPLVIGFEDMRLFNWKGQLWTSSTVRQIHPDGNCEQVLARIEHDHSLGHIKRMLREPRQTQKNWQPISTGYNLSFLYRPGHVVDIHGTTVSEHPSRWDTGQINGGSQLIPYENGWLSLHHEARLVPGRTIRHYWHRFIYHSLDFKVSHVSRPFVFEDKQIEFAAGMCWHPNHDDLVISYGVRDCEAKLATVSHHDVSKLLWFQSK